MNLHIDFSCLCEQLLYKEQPINMRGPLTYAASIITIPSEKVRIRR